MLIKHDSYQFDKVRELTAYLERVHCDIVIYKHSRSIPINLWYFRKRIG